MKLPLQPPLEPMEASSADAVPEGDGWQYEPKWDGFRCLAFRDGAEVRLQSKAGKPLARYFPDVVEALRGLGARRFVLDAELVIPVGDRLDFDQLLLRLHPAASRVRKLAAAQPARLVVFDQLLTYRSTVLLDRPLVERRERLERFAERFMAGHDGVHLSPATGDRQVGVGWLRGGAGGLDGVMAKRLDAPYVPGSRDFVVKVKRLRTADCVVGGFRRASRGRGVGSLLLGLFGQDGLLHHVGFASSFPAAEGKRLPQRVEPLRGGAGFTGSAPGGPSRWARGRSADWEPLAHELVVEVRYDHVTNGRFRHATRFERWRPDKAPRQCTMDQLATGGTTALSLLDGGD